MKKAMITLLLASSSLSAVAYQLYSIEALEKERQQVVVQYLESLANASTEGMQAIFQNDSIVVSTSAGKKNALEFFSGFFPLIQTAHTEIHQRFNSQSDLNRYGARFHLDYLLSDGSKGNGEYVDEFVFYDNSAKLKAVYMFENLNFPQDV